MSVSLPPQPPSTGTLLKIIKVLCMIWCLAVLFAILLFAPSISRAESPELNLYAVYQNDAKPQKPIRIKGLLRHARQSRSLGSAPSNLVALAQRAALNAGIPWGLASGVIKVESNWQAHVRGAAGEYGLTQIKCQTARGLGFSGGCGQLGNASVNLHWGFEHLARAYAKCGTILGAAKLHNAGLGASCTASGYSHKVMRAAR
jgi:soluble lytic murein transglycosylase-like protein